MNKIIDFVKKEIVLSVAFVLAILSSFYVLPDREYINYIDFKVLALLFCLMLVVSGLKSLGILDTIANALIRMSAGARSLAYILILMCFFFAMLITNDVALITFVPLGMLVLKKSNLSEYIIPVVILQTVAANLGSMLTPIGNPQNLYIYSAYNMNMSEFVGVVLPYAAISLVLICICTALFVKEQNISYKNNNVIISDKSKNKKDRSWYIKTFFYFFLFVISMLTVMRILDYIVPVIIALIGILILDRNNILKADYCLLATFVCFFIFIGNMGRIEAVNNILFDIIQGNELLTGFLSSQVISNVPAAILLSGFTDNYKALLLGVNIGGLGTLIASLASLISYKYIAVSIPHKKGEYIKKFTIINIGFAAVLLLKGLVL